MIKKDWFILRCTVGGKKLVSFGETANKARANLYKNLGKKS
jgi:hypothetical protein